MNIQERRREKGWSQEELARHCGLSTRTVQRIEGGQKAGLESLKCLAAVFETSISALMQEHKMNDTKNPNQSAISEFEREAMEHVQKLKAVRIHLMLFALIMPALYALNLFISPDYLWVVFVAIAWGSALILLFAIFAFSGLWGASWEQRQFKKRMSKYNL
ncbi:MAG: helix-turn-helix domain-containing protein [Alphaproteobacteria bacterium]|nr:helix-turn-helix domain-containing protein [Alphaproteobacteria bacterium]